MSVQVQVPRVCGSAPYRHRPELTQGVGSHGCNRRDRRWIDTKTAANRLKLDPDTVAAIAQRGTDPVAGLRTEIPEEFWTWYDTAVDEYRVAAGQLIDQYEALVGQARTESGTTRGRYYAEAAIRLASENDCPPVPCSVSTRDGPETYASIWTQLRPKGAANKRPWQTIPTPETSPAAR